LGNVPVVTVYKRQAFSENKRVAARRQGDSPAVIRRLLASQKLGVLATRELRSPYQSLVAFAVSRDLRHIYFTTAISTRKYANLSRFPQVSMLFDNRMNAAADFYRGVAVTALGRAERVTARSTKAVLGLFLRRHPALDSFVKSPSCRLFQVNVKTYILVTEFQQVITYKPAP
jgi:nitroimidazol reductase NimA-like FMN-containing flavoprotein (pyridoxamine 5'-phosphate oxidase superfamily)